MPNAAVLVADWIYQEKSEGILGGLRQVLEPDGETGDIRRKLWWILSARSNVVARWPDRLLENYAKDVL
jgi:hypothetical protein